jgi:dihydrofolate reductase
MKVLLYVTVSRDGYIAGKYDDISRISPESQTQRARLVNGVGNMIVGRRTYDTMCRAQRFDTLQDPFVTIMSKHNYPSQPNRHFTHAKPKNILKLLDEKGRSSTVVA